MYNPERKARYLEARASESTRELCRQAFAATAEYEQAWDTDLCAWDTDRWRHVLSRRLGLRVKSTDLFLILLRGYAAWCGEQGYPVSEALWQVEVDNGEKVKRHMVASPEHLQILFDQVFDPEGDDTIDCVYRTFLWMAYAGLEDREALAVRVGDVDLASLCIRFEGQRYALYPQAMEAVRRAVELDRFVYHHPRYGRAIVRERAAGELVMRGIKVEAMNLYTLRSLLNRKFSGAGLSLSYRRILLSGVFYRAAGREARGLPPAFGLVIAKAMENSPEKGESARQRAARMEREYLADYNQWKKAFGGQVNALEEE